MDEIKLAVIGGTGLYTMNDLEILEQREVNTPYGAPSGQVIIGRLAGRVMAFLPRHGTRHHLNPSHINYRANIWALKKIGVNALVSISAVGSLKAEIKPRDVVIPDQLIDRTKSRVNSFFEPLAVHVAFADPFCPYLSGILEQAVRSTNVDYHRGGTYVCMEGPLFSTRAESNLYRSWGASVIGMTALPEAKLAREAEISYAAVNLVTDYDCWYEESEDVSIDMVFENLRANASNAQDIVRWVAANYQEDPEQQALCFSALQYALLSKVEDIPPEQCKAFRLLLGKYHSF